MKILRKIKTALSILTFVLMNVYKSLGLKKLSPRSCVHKHVGGYTVCGLDKNNKTAVYDLYCKYNSSQKVSLANKIIWHYLGNKLCFILEDENKQVIGINLYYFNKRDVKQGTIHEAFIGISAQTRGKGLATMLRKTAIDHLKKSGLKGVSTRISLNNLPSLQSSLKLGFKPVETYFDEKMQEERHYLINWF